jgi:hypothetical protein
MYQFIYHLIFILINPQYFTNIEQKNVLKVEFSKDFNSKKYKNAIDTFEKIEKVSKLIEPELRLDAAHAYFIIKDTLKARKNYELAVDLPDNKYSSEALNQLGTLAVLNGDSAKGLEYYKNAIIKDNMTHEARYNYELIKRLYKPKFTPPPPQQNEKQNRRIEASIDKEEEFDQYKSNNISKQKALQLLDDLKNSEAKAVLPSKKSYKKSEKDW